MLTTSTKYLKFVLLGIILSITLIVPGTTSATSGTLTGERDSS